MGLNEKEVTAFACWWWFYLTKKQREKDLIKYLKDNKHNNNTDELS